LQLLCKLASNIIFATDKLSVLAYNIHCYATGINLISIALLAGTPSSPVAEVLCYRGVAAPCSHSAQATFIRRNREVSRRSGAHGSDKEDSEVGSREEAKASNQ
jgi:hypothetical protein